LAAAQPLDEAAQRRFVAKLNDFRAGLDADEQLMLDALVVAVRQAHEQGTVSVFWFQPADGYGTKLFGETPSIWLSYGMPAVNTLFSDALGRAAGLLADPTGISGPGQPQAPLVDAPCPPHHWLIVNHGSEQVWTCQRCGACREHRLTTEDEGSGPWRGYSGPSTSPPRRFGQ
jgi:hypothetical protein